MFPGKPKNFPHTGSINSETGEKIKRKQVKRACYYCRSSHTGCDDERPCRRCITIGKAHLCTDDGDAPQGTKRKRSPSRNVARKTHIGHGRSHMSTDSDEHSSSSGEDDRASDWIPDDSSSEKPTTSVDYMLPSLKPSLSGTHSDKIQPASSELLSPTMAERTGCPNLPNLQVVSFADVDHENENENVPISMSPNSMNFPMDFNAIFETTTSLFKLKDITTSYGQFSSCQMPPAQLQTIPSMSTNSNSPECLGVAVSVWNLQGYLESGNDAFFQYFKMPTIQGNYGPHFSSILHADHLDFGFAIFNNVFFWKPKVL